MDQKKKTMRALRNFIIKTVIIVGCARALLTFVFGIHHLKGNNMYPALRDGDLVLTYKLEAYHLGDIIVYEKDGKEKCGRIVALPGSVIETDESGMLIDGMRPSEQIFYPTEFTGGSVSLPYTVSDSAYFVLNDYRTDLNDSRTYAAIEEAESKGKVICILRRRGF